ncbi:MAG: gliding motility-associated ABC transporter ATP-binding subunit GldA [Bacteroidetes bacterium GWF2_38_335]|nr:MAG: gliding motility-associated ABC transporter ATP-binding subunit GldA [Bacteroidetes bacterium GWF2_38_335]OFY77191.1 MAG: gliding motility-associated ABC transporter ATP-binding subunit GldA [Bacteroidetes bacterium RIFOXYA12_FULL_38_20]HBS85809.1 gliding motility-associated ABC transporter ATP-binding subunit GldA [Bacteroidales bacterium]
MAISVKNISKIYGKQKALDNVSFEIRTGDVVGFLGPNGAGKSTMMKIITGFIPQSSGEVYVNGNNVTEKSLLVRREIGYLPENNPLYLDMYVKEYLKFVAGLYDLENAKARVEEMIKKTGLTVEQHKKIGALSKGYRQRVGLAQALIHDPKVLILDEPTSGLDPNQIVEIRNLISEIGKEKTVMLSTHIMQEVEAICDKIIIINKGMIVADDTTKHIQESLSAAEQQVTVEFDSMPDINEIKKLPGVSKIISHKENTVVLESKGDADIRPIIFNYAVEKKLTVLSLQKQEKSLEKVFQELTK